MIGPHSRSILLVGPASIEIGDPLVPMGAYFCTQNIRWFCGLATMVPRVRVCNVPIRITNCEGLQFRGPFLARFFS